VSSRLLHVDRPVSSSSSELVEHSYGNVCDNVPRYRESVYPCDVVISRSHREKQRERERECLAQINIRFNYKMS